MKPDYCNQCGTFLGYKTGALYCSGACKAKAYRARVKAEKSAPDSFGNVSIDDRSPVEKAIDTKRNEQRFKQCPHCRNEFPVNGLQKGRRYCSDACKQAAYREREAYRALWRDENKQQAPIESITVADNVSEIVKQAWSDALDD